MLEDTIALLVQLTTKEQERLDANQFATIPNVFIMELVFHQMFATAMEVGVVKIAQNLIAPHLVTKDDALVLTFVLASEVGQVPHALTM